MSSFVQKGGLWVLAQNSLTLALLAAGPMQGDGTWHWRWRALGVLLFAMGAWFGITGVRALGRSRTPLPKPIHDAPLVQSGIYRIVRHPLYSSLIFLSVGWSLFWSSFVALALLLNRKARLEERWLREKFPEYEAYASRVRRLVPWVY